MKYFIIFIFAVTVGHAGVEVYLVKVDKSENRLFLLDGKKIVGEYAIALSANPEGHKQQEGDEKTPEGRYILDYKKEDSSFYRAMHISYPNKQDVQTRKNGGFLPVVSSWFTGNATGSAGCHRLLSNSTGRTAVSRCQTVKWMNLWHW